MNLKKELIKLRMRISGIKLPEDYKSAYLKFYKKNFNNGVDINYLLYCVEFFFERYGVDPEKWDNFFANYSDLEKEIITCPKFEKVIYLSIPLANYVYVQEDGTIIDASNIESVFGNNASNLNEVFVGKNICEIEQELVKNNIYFDESFKTILKNYQLRLENYRRFMEVILINLSQNNIELALEVAKKYQLDSSIIYKNDIKRSLRLLK